ncbi:MAG TPA: hypothetical protein DF783_05325 [Acidimicrobiaceae bacterium]|nr:hypothetical protein [Acidimicrobiaceae bacterium]HCV36329.1 hypothetical protein [Acidimicrobiaceae bacterium]
MHDIDDLERRGVPGVFVASGPFEDAAEVQAAALGLPVRGVFVDHPIQDRSDEEMLALADGAFSALLAGLSKQ